MGRNNHIGRVNDPQITILISPLSLYGSNNFHLSTKLRSLWEDFHTWKYGKNSKNENSSFQGYLVAPMDDSYQNILKETIPPLARPALLVGLWSSWKIV